MLNGGTPPNEMVINKLEYEPDDECMEESRPLHLLVCHLFLLLDCKRHRVSILFPTGSLKLDKCLAHKWSVDSN